MHNTSSVDTTGDGDPFELFGATMGEWGKGLQGLGSVVGGISDFLDFGNTKKQSNRNWDLSLGNFANQAQLANNSVENSIRSRLSNAGLAAGPELEAAVAEELQRTGVSSDPYAAAAGSGPTVRNPQTQGNNFLSMAPTSGDQVNPQQPIQSQPGGGGTDLNFGRRPGGM